MSGLRPREAGCLDQGHTAQGAGRGLTSRGLAMRWRFSEKKERSGTLLVNTWEHPRVPAVVVSGLSFFSWLVPHSPAWSVTLWSMNTAGAPRPLSEEAGACSGSRGVRRAENLAKRGETEGPGSRGWGGSGFGRRGWGGAPGSQARVRDLARSSERTRGPLPARGPAGRSSQRVSRSILTARSPPLRSRGPRGAARGVNSGPQKQVHREATRRESWTLSTWDAARPPAHHRVLEEGTSLFGKK